MADIKNDHGTGLVSHWILDEASGTRFDSHGSNDLTDNNTVTSTTDGSDTVAVFDDSNSEYLSITDAAQSGLEPTDFTMSAWYKMDRLPSTATKQSMGIMGKKAETGTNESYNFNFNDFDNDLEVSFGNSSGKDNIRTSSPFAASGDVSNWVHLMITYDNSTRTIKIYKNGSEVVNSTNTSGSTPTLNSASEFSLGRGNYSDSTAYFAGRMKHVSVWNVVKTTTDVQDVYNSGTPLNYDDGGGGGVTVSSTVLSATFSIPSHSVTTGTQASGTPLTATFSIPAASISTDGNATVSSGVLSATFSIPTAGVTTTGGVDVTASATTLSATFSLQSFSIETGTQVSTTPLSATFSLVNTSVIAERDAVFTVSPLTAVFSMVTPASVGTPWSDLYV